jgi:hypothetical protein
VTNFILISTDFELMPGTKAKKVPPAKPSKDPFEAPPIANSDGA